jgi:ubiquinone/menaquinone biosynthesis C-methylase UbiE
LVDLLAIAPGANVLDVATGTNIILGVNSFVSNPNCDGVTYSQRIDIADILAWINGFMA